MIFSLVVVLWLMSGVLGGYILYRWADNEMYDVDLAAVILSACFGALTLSLSILCVLDRIVRVDDIFGKVIFKGKQK